MKVGDLVKNGHNHVGIVIAIGYAGKHKTYLESDCINPDVHVITSQGRRLWSYKALELLK